MAETESGRARVRRLLIDPLIGAGLKRHPRMKDDAYKAMLDRLAGKLAYLGDEQLGGLVDLCVRMAQGKRCNVWPDEVSICKWAYRMQAPPTNLSEYAPSLMRSEMGRRARALGYHVELFWLACRIGPPPSKYELSRLMAKAEANRRKMAQVTGQIERGAALDDDRKWLDWYLRQEEACLSIMDAREEGAAA